MCFEARILCTGDKALIAQFARMGTVDLTVFPA